MVEAAEVRLLRWVTEFVVPPELLEWVPELGWDGAAVPDPLPWELLTGRERWVVRWLPEVPPPPRACEWRTAGAFRA